MEEEDNAKAFEWSHAFNPYAIFLNPSSYEKKIFLPIGYIRKQNTKNFISYGGFCIEADASSMSILCWNCQELEALRQFNKFGNIVGNTFQILFFHGN